MDEKSISEATLVMRSWIVEGGETPELRVFGDFAGSAVEVEEWEGENVDRSLSDEVFTHEYHILIRRFRVTRSNVHPHHRCYVRLELSKGKRL